MVVMPNCPICGRNLQNPGSKSHINSTFHQNALKNSNSSLVQKRISTKDSSVSPIINPSEIANAPIIIQLSQTVNQLITYTKEQFELINKRLQNLEKINKIQIADKKDLKEIELNAKNCLNIIKFLSKQKKRDYLTFYDLRNYIKENYIINEKNWERYLEELRDAGKIEFSKGAKKTNSDSGYTDKFKMTYYYFRLI